ncbi:MAG: HEAT repeat domain-containing protein [Verrucomicrobiia bacterium]
MPIPSTFTEATEWEMLVTTIRNFGDTGDWTEGDLLAALRATGNWPERFTDPFTLEYRGEQITWYRYESLVWTLGESFRRVMLRIRRLRRQERVFEAVRAVCLDRRFGKGRESFTMLLGHYGGPAQIPTLIRLLDDTDVSGHAVYALRLLGAFEAADRVRPFLDSPKTWVRQQARKYFQKIEMVAQT